MATVFGTAKPLKIGHSHGYKVAYYRRDDGGPRYGQASVVCLLLLCICSFTCGSVAKEDTRVVREVQLELQA